MSLSRMWLFVILGLLYCASSHQLPASHGNMPHLTTAACPEDLSITCNVTFVAFVPCMNRSSVTQTCDSLVYPAVLQAAEDVNSLDTIVRNGSQEEAFNLKMNLIPIVTHVSIEAIYLLIIIQLELRVMNPFTKYIFCQRKLQNVLYMM